MGQQLNSGDPMGEWLGLAETCTRSGIDFWSGMADIWMKPAQTEAVAPVAPEPAPSVFGWAMPAPARNTEVISFDALWAPWLAPMQALSAMQAPRQYRPGTEWMAMWFPAAAPAPTNPFQDWVDAWAEGASRAMMPEPMAQLTDTLRDPRMGLPFVSYRSDGGHAVAQIAHTSTRNTMAMMPAFMALAGLMMSFIGGPGSYQA